MKDIAISIIRHIKSLGYEAYLVGGCVRDTILGIEPVDYDITTNMPMDIIKKEFYALPVGEKYGVLMIIKDGYEFEIAQFRNEIYRDSNRKPIVTFSESLYEDLDRRDFTINAIAMDDNGEIFCDEKCLFDLKHKIIRFVGDPYIRINEDPLRIMRGIRFLAKFKCTINSDTKQAIIDNVDKLRSIPYERICDELNKGIMLDNVMSYFSYLNSTGILKVIMPELDRIFGYKQKNSHHEFELHMHTLLGVERSIKDLKVRWAVLLHDIGKPDTAVEKSGQLTYNNHQTVGAKIAFSIMKRLKFPNDISYFVVESVLRHMGTFDSYKVSAIKKLYNIFKEDLPLFIQVKIGDYYGHRLSDNVIIKINKMLDLYKRIYEYMYGVIENQNTFKLSDLAINGNTLIKLGYIPGKIFSTILSDVFDKVIDGELENSEEVLTSYVLENYTMIHVTM